MQWENIVALVSIFLWNNQSYQRPLNYDFSWKYRFQNLSKPYHPASEGGKRRLIILLSVSCEEWDSVEIFMKLSKKIGIGMPLHNLTKCVYNYDSGDIFLTFRQVF